MLKLKSSFVVFGTDGISEGSFGADDSGSGSGAAGGGGDGGLFPVHPDLMCALSNGKLPNETRHF